MRAQGANPAITKPREAILTLTQEMLTEARQLVAPAVVYEVYPVEEVSQQRLVLRNGRSFQAGRILDQLASASEIAVLIGTVGQRLEKQASRYFDQGHPAKGVVLDSIGSAAVEELLESACHVIEELAAAKEMQTSSPFSPGYLDWPLDQQVVIFDLLPADAIGVTLTESLLMIPRKSLSAVVALGNGSKVESRSTCEICSIGATCRYRHPAESRQRRHAQLAAGGQPSVRDMCN